MVVSESGHRQPARRHRRTFVPPPDWDTIVTGAARRRTFRPPDLPRPTSPTGPIDKEPSFMKSLATWCVRHRMWVADLLARRPGGRHPGLPGRGHRLLQQLPAAPHRVDRGLALLQAGAPGGVRRLRTDRLPDLGRQEDLRPRGQGGLDDMLAKVAASPTSPRSSAPTRTGGGGPGLQGRHHRLRHRHLRPAGATPSPWPRPSTSWPPPSRPTGPGSGWRCPARWPRSRTSSRSGAPVPGWSWP